MPLPYAALAADAALWPAPRLMACSMREMHSPPVCLMAVKLMQPLVLPPSRPTLAELAGSWLVPLTVLRAPSAGPAELALPPGSDTAPTCGAPPPPLPPCPHVPPVGTQVPKGHDACAGVGLHGEHGSCRSGIWKDEGRWRRVGARVTLLADASAAVAPVSTSADERLPASLRIVCVACRESAFCGGCPAAAMKRRRPASLFCIIGQSACAASRGQAPCPF
eukprot:366010-Chlamydomonas_euryale.AAC.7